MRQLLLNVLMHVNLSANLQARLSLCLSCLSAHQPVCLSVSRKETQLSHIILWHSNFPLNCYWKTPKWLKRDAWMWPSHNDTKKKTERDDMRNDIPLHFTSILFCSLSFWCLCPLSFCLLLSFSNVAYLGFHPTLFCPTCRLLVFYHTENVIE